MIRVLLRSSDFFFLFSFSSYFSTFTTVVLESKQVDTAKTLEAVLPYCLGTATPHTFSLVSYLSRQLQPRRESRPETVPIVQREQIIEESNERVYYTPEDYEQAEAFFRALKEPMRLADLLQLAIDIHLSQQILEIIVLLVLQYFDPRDVSVPLLKVEKIDEKQFSIGGFTGNNVLLSSKEMQNER